MPRKTYYCPPGIHESTNWDNFSTKKWMCGVLVDNWYEDAMQRCPPPERVPMSDETEYRMEFPPRGCVNTYGARLRNRIKQSLTNTNLLFAHHEMPSPKYMITTYDEHINKRARPCCQEFPEQRTWDMHRKCWKPEKSDFPLTGHPTNWGLTNWLDSQHYANIKDLLEAYKDVQSENHSSFIDHFEKQKKLKKEIPCYMSHR